MTRDVLPNPVLQLTNVAGLRGERMHHKAIWQLTKRGNRGFRGYFRRMGTFVTIRMSPRPFSGSARRT
jgi:hypothetical protein